MVMAMMGGIILIHDGLYMQKVGTKLWLCLGWYVPMPRWIELSAWVCSGNLSKCNIQFSNWGCSSVAERLFRIQKVGGSIPSISIYSQYKFIFNDILFLMKLFNKHWKLNYFCGNASCRWDLMRNKKWLKKSSWISFRLRIQRAILGLVSVFCQWFHLCYIYLQ